MFNMTNYICLCPQQPMTTLVDVYGIYYSEYDTVYCTLIHLIQYCVCNVHIIYKIIELEFTLV